MTEQVERASFSGKLGFILATSASAVGLGNLWRFPYEASHYGGGIFVLVYVILAFTFGLCLMLNETAIGRRTGKSCIAAFGELREKYRFIGYLCAIIPILVVPYYCVIGGWVLKWLFETTIGNLDLLAGDDGSYWWDFVTGETELGFLSPSLWFILFTLICVVCIIAGVEKGIEKMSKYLVPVLLIMIVGITIYEFTIPGIWDGIVYYLSPDLDELSADTFLGAISQIFYSVSIAMGILITYGSYAKKEVDLEKSSFNIVAIDTIVAILAGMMIVPVAFLFGFPDSSGMGLMFTAMPQVFESMTGGAFIAPLFYLLVAVAALTSAISLAETCASVFIDGTKTDRPKATAITTIIILAFGMLCVLGFYGGPLFFDSPLDQGVGWLGFFDTITNSIMMPIASIIICIFVGYVIKIKLIDDEIMISSPFRFRKIFDIMIMYVCPILLSVMLITAMISMLS